MLKLANRGGDELQVSISPTFYKLLFQTKDFRAAFLHLHCRFILFWRKEIGAKAAHKMLVKFTPGLRGRRGVQQKKPEPEICHSKVFRRGN